MKPLSSYYKHKGMADGHENQCIDCKRSRARAKAKERRQDAEWVAKRREKDRERYHENRKNEEWVSRQRETARKTYERSKEDIEWVYRKRDRNNKNKRSVVRTPRSAEQIRDVMSRYNAKYPEKYLAKSRSQNLRKEGFEKHHWNYSEGFEKNVIWLTRTQHNYLHRYMEYDGERMMYRCTRNVGSFERGDLLDTKFRHIKYYLTLKKQI